MPEIVDVVAADGTGAGGVEGADVDDDDDDEDDDEDEDEDDDDDGVRALGRKGDGELLLKLFCSGSHFWK